MSNSTTETDTTHTVGVTPAQTTDTTQTEASDTASTSQGASTGASEQVPLEVVKPAEPTVVMVKVSVAEGQVSWLEITADGESSIADTITGPWEQTYDVKTQLIVRAGETPAVSVSVNGEQRQFEMKSSGVGTIIVDGPPQSATTDADKKAEGAEGSEQGSEQSSEQSSESGYETPEEGSKNSDGDEYQYTYNGYDMYIDHNNGNLYCIDPETGAKLNPADGTPYTG